MKGEVGVSCLYIIKYIYFYWCSCEFIVIKEMLLLMIKKKKKNGVCIAKKFCVCEIEKLSVLCIEIVSAKK